jgi:hypothetical protein
MFKDYASPGEEVRSLGTYRVHHYQHRLPHLVTLTVARFPRCNRCGDMMKYENVELVGGASSKSIHLDEDFKSTCDVSAQDNHKKTKGSECR